MVGTPEAEDSKNRMETCSMVGVSKSSFAEKCKGLFEDWHYNKRGGVF